MVEAGTLVQGQVIRFDPIKGYGFIAPKDGGEDVFLHVNDLLDEKYLIRPGVVVEFFQEAGQRGPKASAVQIVEAPPVAPRITAPLPIVPVPAASADAVPVKPDVEPAARAAGESQEGFVDVLREADFANELTELLLPLDEALTGPQILAVRRVVTALAEKYGWIGD